MRGSIKGRYKGSWSLILDFGYEPQIDKATGQPKVDANGKPLKKRNQKWITFRGTKKQAEAKLNELVHAAEHGQFVEPSKMTLGQWLTDWLKLTEARVRRSSYVRYSGVVEKYLLTSALAPVPIQKVRPSHLEAYYATLTKMSASSRVTHHSILLSALRKAEKDGLITTNPAERVDAKPKRARHAVSDEARNHAWSADEARAFLTSAKAAGPQPAAFYSLALDTGMRKSELGGLRWSSVDLDAGKVRVVEQLTKGGPAPEFGPTKTGRPRTVALAAETVTLLRAHRKAQAELKMKNRSHYADFGLAFAKEWNDVKGHGDTLGHPLQLNNLGEREFARLIKAAKVRRIKFHGLRHTCATLLLQAGQPVHVVGERLGHTRVAMTMEVYAHVLPDMQQDAAAALGALLHRR
ncbi:MAG: site-specific integrase [Vicinamibacterales bacterium]